MKRFELKFNDLHEYKLKKDHVLNFIKEFAPKQEVFFLYLVINEAVNNALFHSNTKKEIKLIVDFSIHGRFFVRVKDSGCGFEGNERINNIKNSSGNLFQDRLYEEGGRGLLLMDEICDHITYNVQGNEVLLVKKL